MVVLDTETPGTSREIYGANAGKELSLSSRRIALSYIYHSSTVVDFSS